MSTSDEKVGQFDDPAIPQVGRVEAWVMAHAVQRMTLFCKDCDTYDPHEPLTFARTLDYEAKERDTAFDALVSALQDYAALWRKIRSMDEPWENAPISAALHEKATAALALAEGVRKGDA